MNSEIGQLVQLPVGKVLRPGEEPATILSRPMVVQIVLEKLLKFELAMTVQVRTHLIYFSVQLFIIRQKHSLHLANLVLGEGALLFEMDH